MGMKDKFLSDPFSDFDEFPWYSSISPPESLPVLRELVRTLGGPGMCQFHNQASDRSFGRSSRKKVITMSLRTRFWLAAFGGLFVVSSAEAGLQLIEPRTSRPQRAMSSMAPRSMDSMGLTLTNPPPTPPLLRPTLPKPSHVAPERPANFNRPETPDDFLRRGIWYLQAGDRVLTAGGTTANGPNSLYLRAYSDLSEAIWQFEAQHKTEVPEKCVLLNVYALRGLVDSRLGYNGRASDDLSVAIQGISDHKDHPCPLDNSLASTSTAISIEANLHRQRAKAYTALHRLEAAADCAWIENEQGLSQAIDLLVAESSKSTLSADQRALEQDLSKIYSDLGLIDDAIRCLTYVERSLRNEMSDSNAIPKEDFEARLTKVLVDRGDLIRNDGTDASPAQLGNAYADYNEAVKLAPTDPDVLHNAYYGKAKVELLGENYVRVINTLTSFLDARKKLQKRLDDEPWTLASRGNLFVLLTYSGQGDRTGEALTDLNRALQNNMVRTAPERFQVHLSRANAFLFRSDWQSALDDFNAVLNLDSENQDAIDGATFATAQLNKPKVTAPKVTPRNRAQEQVDAINKEIAIADAYSRLEEARVKAENARANQEQAKANQEAGRFQAAKNARATLDLPKPAPAPKADPVADLEKAARVESARAVIENAKSIQEKAKLDSLVNGKSRESILKPDPAKPDAKPVADPANAKAK
jgi:tetratricopeptide (TPR) repeat protein